MQSHLHGGCRPPSAHPNVCLGHYPVRLHHNQHAAFRRRHGYKHFLHPNGRIHHDFGRSAVSSDTNRVRRLGPHARLEYGEPDDYPHHVRLQWEAGHYQRGRRQSAYGRLALVAELLSDALSSPGRDRRELHAAHELPLHRPSGPRRRLPRIQDRFPLRSGYRYGRPIVRRYLQTARHHVPIHAKLARPSPNRSTLPGLPKRYVRHQPSLLVRRLRGRHHHPSRHRRLPGPRSCLRPILSRHH